MRRKVLFMLPSLNGGGAERVLLILLKHLDPAKFDVSLAVVAFEGPYVKQLPPNISIYDLGVKRVRYMFIPLLKLVWKLKPDTIFSTLGYLNIALVLLRPFLAKRVKLIIREGSIVSYSIKHGKLAFLWPYLYRTFYKKADLIVCQSRFMMKDLEDHFQIPAGKMRQIYNPVDIDTIKRKAGSGENPFAGKAGTNIVAIGRLSHEKGFARLIESVPDLLMVRPDARLWILGTGPLENELRSLTYSLGLHDRVIFAGFQENPYCWLKHADLFVLSSFFEGLPNVLLEAIALSCPVLAIRHPGGTGEIMELTGQSDRLIDTIGWKEDWFARPDRKASVKLEQHFEVGGIVGQYASVM
ncbi:glycosyltransferase [Paenibacillus hemerocallicola]|nr:glycosyltransferase [Paenibacillus hemerocallicola]